MKFSVEVDVVIFLIECGLFVVMKDIDVFWEEW